MLRKFLTAVGLVTVATSAPATPPYSPYGTEASNAIYNLLFCDDATGFAAKAGQTPTEWQTVLAAQPANLADLRKLANDSKSEGRVRFLAFQQLRNAGIASVDKVVLGAIVEMSLDDGLDTLAAYSDGSVRYINRTGKIAVIESHPETVSLVRQLIASSDAVVRKIGPWDKPRRAPPPRGSVRLTFLVSDGHYFGEGRLSVMQKDSMAAPLLLNATELLLKVVALATK